MRGVRRANGGFFRGAAACTSPLNADLYLQMYMHTGAFAVHSARKHRFVHANVHAYGCICCSFGPKTPICTCKCTCTRVRLLFIRPENAVLYMQMYMHNSAFAVHSAPKNTDLYIYVINSAKQLKNARKSLRFRHYKGSCSYKNVFLTPKN